MKKEEMKMEDQNQENEKAVLNLDNIRLTKSIIYEINSIQTGGTDLTGKVEDRFFTNYGLNEEIKDLNSLQDFLISLYDRDDFTDTKILMTHLRCILAWKNHFEAFMV